MAVRQVGKMQPSSETTRGPRLPNPRPAGPTPAAGHVAPWKANSHVAQLTAMGFDDASARAALARHAWDVNRALDSLFQQLEQKNDVADAKVRQKDDERSPKVRSPKVQLKTWAETQVEPNTSLSSN